MTRQIRQADIQDIQAIAEVYTAVWQNQIEPAQIEKALNNSDNIAHIALLDHQVVGFVDGFLTRAFDGRLRWELDLIAVHPQAQGQGIGKQLIEASLETAREKRAQFSRGLIQIENIGSQKAFEKNGYTVMPTKLELMVASEWSSTLHSLPRTAHIVPVVTFSYSGLWLENDFSESSLQAVQTMCHAQSLDVAGVLIPADQQAVIELAQAIGYKEIDLYQWWMKDL